MAMEETEDPRDAQILDSLSPEEREALERDRYVKSGDSLVWFDSQAVLRKQKLANLYYIQTDRGVFRVSRISQEVIRV